MGGARSFLLAPPSSPQERSLQGFILSLAPMLATFFLLHSPNDWCILSKAPAPVYFEDMYFVDSLPVPSREGVDSRFVERMTIQINKWPASSQVCPADQSVFCN